MRGRFSSLMPAASTKAGDHFLCATSRSSMPEASQGSVMNSPLIRKRRKSLGARTMAMLFEQLWFMGLEPEELWRGEARHRRHPGKLPDIGKFPVEGSGFRPGASVIPKNGWTKNLARRIQNHGPMHLSGKPDRRNAQPRPCGAWSAGFCRPSARPATSPAAPAPTSRAAAV